MNRAGVVFRRPNAGLLVASIVVSIVAACSGGGVVVPSATVAPTTPAPPATPSQSPTPSRSPQPTVPPAFPTEAFIGISLEPLDHEASATLDRLLTDMAGRGGMAATVMSPDGTWSGAAGKADGLRDVQVDSQFGIASVTKSVIAAQVMQLVEAGELSLDDPASDYLPADFAFDTNGATIRQLLDMHAGIPDWYGDAMEREVATNRDRLWTLSEVLALVAPGRTPPGTTFLYTDTNYVLLGLAIEHVRERPLIDVLRSGVLQVEGTERLIYQPDEAPTEPMAMPGGEPGDALERGGGYLPSVADASSAGPAGSMASDSISLARWWLAFCAGDIVSEGSLTQMATFVDVEAYGLGLFNPADGYAGGVGHLGSSFGYVSWAGCLPEKRAVVVVLTNQAIDDIGGLARPLVEALAD